MRQVIDRGIGEGGWGLLLMMGFKEVKRKEGGSGLVGRVLLEVVVVYGILSMS